MLYHENGYLNIPWILAQGCPFNFVVGGRGTGKTYGALKYIIEDNRAFMYIRRTQAQIDIVSDPAFSPFKSLNRDLHINIGSAPITKYNAGFYHMQENDKGRQIPAGPAIGYAAALSTFANLRGFDASDVELLIYDEFIPERHERPIKNEGAALLNAYETVNRNRELSGRSPLQLLALANANDLGNAIFMELGLVGKAEKMRRTGQECSIDKKRGIALFILNASPISNRKKDTALYRASSGSAFSAMSLDNAFSEMSSRSIGSRPLAEYKPVVTAGEVTIYRHKSKSEYYVSQHRAGGCPTYGADETERTRFCRAYPFIWGAYMENNILFENATCEIYLTKYIK